MTLPSNPASGILGVKPSSREEIFTTGKSAGRAGGAATRKASEDKSNQEWEDHHRDLANQEPVAEKQDENFRVKLSNPKWDREKAQCESEATASVTVEGIPEGSLVTKVEFALWQLKPDGKRELCGKRESSHAKDGHAEYKFVLPAFAPALARPEGKSTFFFTAKHSHSDEVTGPLLVADPETEMDCVVYYSPATGEYLVLETEAQFKAFNTDIQKVEELRGKSAQALGFPDAGKRRDALAEIRKTSGEVFEEEQKDQDGKQSQGDAGSVVEELLLVRQCPKWGKPRAWTWMPKGPTSKGGRTTYPRKKANDAKVEKIMKDLMRSGKDSKKASPLFKSEFKLKLWQKDPFETQWPWKWRTELLEDGKKRNDPGFHFSKEAAVCRLAMGWDGLGASANFKEKKVQVGTSGYVSYALFEGSISANVAWPHEGVNLLEYIGLATGTAYFLKQGRKCMFRLKFEAKAGAFAGISARSTLAFPDIDFSREKIKKKNGKKIIRNNQIPNGNRGSGSRGHRRRPGYRSARSGGPMVEQP